ncbi:MAG TPA: TylF/MycF/NovP-related O-methyltransferase [Thermoanaerobaculia bacterium]
MRPFTLLSWERLYAIYRAVKYLTSAGIEGDVVECGVWRGGSSMLMASTFVAAGDASRRLFLYDTFAGMTRPTDADRDASGEAAMKRWTAEQQEGFNTWCYAPIEEVRRNVLSTGYPEALIELVKGDVEQTIPARTPGRIALLMLDTDWYASTRHELQHLFPLLVSRGVLIIDDYGHWSGAKKAVDEYFRESGVSLLLNRIDYSGLAGVKP